MCIVTQKAENNYFSTTPNEQGDTQMKKIVTFILLLCMLLSVSACTNKEGTAKESNTPETNAPETSAPETNSPDTEAAEITLEEVYDAGKTFSALLGDHESVYVQIISNGTVLREEYMSKECIYSFYDAEYLDVGYDYADFTTDHSQYILFDNLYSSNVTLTPDGMIDMKDIFAKTAEKNFISSAILNDTVTITENGDSIIVTCIADADDLLLMGEGIISCEETYTLDAKTREMTSVKTVYTYEDGTVEEGIAIITRDVEAPEGAKTFIAYDQIDNMRTITIVSNPGAENEKTDTAQVPSGLVVDIFPDWEIEDTFIMYADAACTQPILDLNVDSDITVYIKWEPADLIDEAYFQRIDEYSVALSEEWDEAAYFDNEMSALAAYYYEGNATDNVGFTLMDLNGDGTQELIIGAIMNSDKDPLVFEIWTIKDGEPVMLAQSGSRNRYYLQYAEETDAWSVAYEAGNNAANHATYYLQLADGELQVIQGIIFDAMANENEPWFMTYDLDWDVSNDTPIDEETATAIVDAERNIYTAVEYIPFSPYK